MVFHQCGLHHEFADKGTYVSVCLLFIFFEFAFARNFPMADSTISFTRSCDVRPGPFRVNSRLAFAQKSSQPAPRNSGNVASRALGIRDAIALFESGL